MKVEIVKNRKYLGSLISGSGSKSPAKEKLKEQADKAYFSLQKIMNRTSYAPNLCLDLFAESIRPILTYNCEILKQISQKKLNKIMDGSMKLEQIHIVSPPETSASQTLQKYIRSF